MSLADHARMMVAYNRWANERALDAARGMTAEQFEAMQGAFAHVLETQMFWHANWTNAQFVEIRPAPFDETRRLFDQSHTEMEAFFATLTDEAWHRSQQWWKRWGYDASMALGETLFQVINHSTQHRSEIALRMTAMGYSPGELDFLVFRLPDMEGA